MTERVLLKWVVAGVCLAALIVGGCRPKTSEASIPASEHATSESAEGLGSVDLGEPTSAARPSLPLSKLPASAPSESLEYLGLKREEPLRMEVEAEGQPTMTGTVSSRLASVEGDKAVFEVERTGSLLGAGTETLEARPDGVFTVAVGGNPVSPAHMALPGTLEIGRSWRTNSSFEMPTGQKVADESTYRIAAREKVQTKLGEFDAVRVDGTGTTTIDGQRLEVQMRAWYAKGKGAVRIEVTSKRPDGQAIKVTMQAVP